MSPPNNWSRWHHRLHQSLLRNPELLPKNSRLLLAISGGQDSMALLGLLRDLQRLHGWLLLLWHGDHGWYPASAQVAQALACWCRDQGFELIISRAEPNTADNEARARDWRYQQLGQVARSKDCDVVTAHTATDRAESVLLNLARGCDLQGLSALPALRPLSDQYPEGPQLRRPLLELARTDTAQICRTLHLPVWVDPSNADLALARNRIRQQVLPVLHQIHPGSDRRIADLSERLSKVRDSQRQLAQLALQALQSQEGLDRRKLSALDHASSRLLLVTWLKSLGAPALSAAKLEELRHRLCADATSGQCQLAEGWRLTWTQTLLRAIQDNEPR